MTSFPEPETGNEVIQDGGRKRKGRHLAPPPQWGSKNAPYTTPTPGVSISVSRLPWQEPDPHATALKHPLAYDVTEALLLVHRHMSYPNLLKDLAKGKMQNPNECLHLVVV